MAHLVLPPAQRRLVTAGAMLAQFLNAIDSTAVLSAMPTVVRDLGGFDLYAWVFTVYTIGGAVSGPLWGRISDLYGLRRVYFSSIAVLLVGTVLCGQAHDMIELIAWRFVQSVGAGAMLPLGYIVLGHIYPREDRARVQGWYSVLVGAGSIFGPIVAGLLVAWTWRAVFYMTVPVGLLALVLLYLYLPASPAESAGRLDLPGAIALTAGSTLLLLFNERVPESGLDLPNLAILGAGIGLLAVLVRIERRAETPLLPLDLFTIPIMSRGLFFMLPLGMGLFGAITYLPLYAQQVLGEPPAQTWIVLAPIIIGWMGLTPLGTTLAIRHGCRTASLIGAAFFVAGYTLLAALPLVPLAVLAAASFLIGLGGAFTSTPIIVAAQSDVPEGALGICTSTLFLVRQLGAAFGVSIMGTILGAAVGQPALLAEPMRHVFVAGIVFGAVMLVPAALLPSARR